MVYLSPEQSPEKRHARLDIAEAQYVEAVRLAGEHGFMLVQRTRVHYQLWPRDKRWLLNIYPSNRRLYHDSKKMGPFLDLPDAWTLLDVVKAAVRQSGENGD